MTVVLDGISKSFGDTRVLYGLDIEVHDGEFMVLLGASGSGKSTALRMIAGLETTTEGQVYIDGRDVTEVLPKNRNVAMVFQSYALYPHKTVGENIGYPLKVRKLPKQEIAAQVRDVASQVQLEDFLDRYPRQLSGGQRQRVALARAMVRRPAVFLMDEPLSNLDAKLRGHMRTELKRMQHKLGITTIYVTHDQVEAMTLADRVAILEAGKLVQLAPPKEIYNDPANLFVAQFIGSPPMNLLHGSLDQGFFIGENLRIPVPHQVRENQATLGVRPEDCQVVAPGSGQFDASLYATELLGDHMLVSAAVGDDIVTVKAGKDFDGELDTPIGIAIEQQALYLFDSQGERIR
jgi:multiple sugar transport system ATP-binding protein